MRKTLLAWPDPESDSDGNIDLSLTVHQPALVCLISLTLSPSSLPDFSWLYKSLIVGVAQMNHTLSVSHYLCCRQHFNPYNFIKHGFDLVCICACTLYGCVWRSDDSWPESVLFSTSGHHQAWPHPYPLNPPTSPGLMATRLRF